MKRREIIWTLIRLTGVCFIGKAIFDSIGFFVILINYSVMNMPAMTDAATTIATMLYYPLILIFAEGIIGIYLLAGGQMIFNAVNNIPSDDDDDGNIFHLDK